MMADMATLYLRDERETHSLDISIELAGERRHWIELLYVFLRKMSRTTEMEETTRGFDVVLIGWPRGMGGEKMPTHWTDSKTKCSYPSCAA